MNMEANTRCLVMGNRMSKDMWLEELRQGQEKNKWSSLARSEMQGEEIVDIKLCGQAVGILDSILKVRCRICLRSIENRAGENSSEVIIIAQC